MMAYEGWLKGHCQKHKAIVDTLRGQGKTQDEIIAYFDFDNMVRNEPDFCKLYKNRQKCHDIEALNCYLCACPHFRFNEDGIETSEDSDGDEITLYSRCAIEHKDGSTISFSSAIHQDCSACRVPHTVNFIQSVYAPDLAQIMHKCDLEEA